MNFQQIIYFNIWIEGLTDQIWQKESYRKYFNLNMFYVNGA
jgi:hypothetical protein